MTRRELQAVVKQERHTIARPVEMAEELLRWRDYSDARNAYDVASTYEWPIPADRVAALASATIALRLAEQACGLRVSPPPPPPHAPAGGEGTPTQDADACRTEQAR